MALIFSGDKYLKGPTNTSLIVNNVTLDDGGDYQCIGVQLSDKISELKEQNIQVKVHRKSMQSSMYMKRDTKKFYIRNYYILQYIQGLNI